MIKIELQLLRIIRFYDSILTKILVRIRKCEKSLILKQIINELKEKGIDDKNIIFINFELI